MNKPYVNKLCQSTIKKMFEQMFCWSLFSNKNAFNTPFFVGQLCCPLNKTLRKTSFVKGIQTRVLTLVSMSYSMQLNGNINRIGLLLYRLDFVN